MSRLSAPRAKAWTKFDNRRRNKRRFIRIALITLALLAAGWLFMRYVETAHGEGRTNYTAHLAMVMQPVRPVESSTGVITRTVEVKWHKAH